MGPADTAVPVTAAVTTRHRVNLRQRMVSPLRSPELTPPTGHRQGLAQRRSPLRASSPPVVEFPTMHRILTVGMCLGVLMSFAGPQAPLPGRTATEPGAGQQAPAVDRAAVAARLAALPAAHPRLLLTTAADRAEGADRRRSDPAAAPGRPARRGRPAARDEARRTCPHRPPPARQVAHGPLAHPPPRRSRGGSRAGPRTSNGPRPNSRRSRSSATGIRATSSMWPR